MENHHQVPSRLVLFVGYLIQQNRKSTTIRSYISAIKSVLRDDGVILNTNSYLLRSLTKACRLHNDQVQIHLPIRKGMLGVLLKNLHNVLPEQPYLLLLYKALFSTAYFGLFRIGELTSGTHPVFGRDVKVSDNKNKMLFILCSSKTHGPESFPQSVEISTREFNTSMTRKKKSFCPFEILRDYMRVRKRGFRTYTEPFFIFKNRKPVKPHHARKVLKDVLEISGFDPSFYNFHCLRGGRVSNLLAMHISVESIKLIGQWKSNSVYVYLK